MPNLQELVPFFQQLFQEWTQFTLDHAPYAITLALSVWLLTAIGYSFSIAWMKRKMRQEQQAHAETRNTLDATQQQLNGLQEQFNSTNEQLAQTSQQLETETKRADSEVQRANEWEQKLVAGNKRLAQGFASLVEKFELIENLPSQIGTDADALWQRCDAISERLIERLQNEQQAKARLQLDVQAEKTKLVDKEIALNNLQSQLSEQTQQVAKLQAAVVDLDLLRNEVDSLKRQLNVAIEKPRVEPTRVVEPETPVAPQRPAVEAPMANIAVEVEPAPEVAAPPAPKPVPVPEQEEIVVTEQPKAAVAPSQSEADENKSKWKSLFGKAKKTDSAAAEKPVQPEPVVLKSEPMLQKPAAQESAAAKSAKKSKWGGLMEQFSKLDEKLGSPTTPKVRAEVQVEAAILPAESAPEPVLVPEIVDDQQSDKNAAGKLGGLLGKFKKS